MTTIKYNTTCIILGLCWILFEQGFFILPSMFGSIYLQDIAIVILLLYTFISLLRRDVVIDFRNDKFAFLSISFEIIMLIAAVMAYFHWGQSLLTSLMPERYLIVILIAYFPIKMSLDKGYVTSDQLLKMLLFLGKLELVIMMVQFVAQYAGIYFLQLNYNNTLFTFARFAGVDGTLVLFAVFYEISNLFEGYGKKVYSLLWIGMGAVLFFLMIQTRMALIGICTAVIVYYITLDTSVNRKILMTVVLSIAAVFVYNSSLFQDTINIQELDSRNTMDIRVSAMTFYVDELSKSPVFGMGAYPNSNTADAARGIDIGYSLNDNGLYGFAYMYGLLGLAWAFYMYCQLIKTSYKYSKYRGQSGFFMFSVYLVAVSSTLIHWYWIRSEVLTMVIMWAILNDYSDKVSAGRSAEIEVNDVLPADRDGGL